MWNRQKLAVLARNRKVALSDVEGALLAFARTQELTDEPNFDVTAAAKELEAALDKLEPEATDKLKLLGSVERDEVLRDFLVTMVNHNQKRIDRELQEVQALQPSMKLAAPKVDTPQVDEAGSAKKRKRKLRLF